MAKAVAHCKCEKCGAEFIRESYCSNRRNANSWEEWAEEAFTLCTDCWKEQQREERKAKREAQGLVCDVFVNPTLTREKGVVMCTLIADGDTYPYKEMLKVLGYRWNSDYPDSGICEPGKRWNKSAPIDQAQKLYDEFESIGGRGRYCFTEVDIAMAQKMLDMRKTEKKEEES
jgi:hypothetical protein